MFNSVIQVINLNLTHEGQNDDDVSELQYMWLTIVCFPSWKVVSKGISVPNEPKVTLTRKTAGTAETPARQQTLFCDIQIQVVINC